MASEMRYDELPRSEGDLQALLLRITRGEVIRFSAIVRLERYDHDAESGPPSFELIETREGDGDVADGLYQLSLSGVSEAIEDVKDVLAFGPGDGAVFTVSSGEKR